MKERIAKLRGALGMTLEQFCAALGVQKSAISKIEHGERMVTEQMINSMLKTIWPGGRRVSEAWLRSGSGEMFVDLSPEEEMIRCVSAVQAGGPSQMQLRFIRAVAKLPPDKWKIIEDLMLEMVRGEDDGRGEPPIISL